MSETQQQRMRDAWAKCRCGAGCRMEGKTLVMRPHAPNCEGLRAACDLARREKRCTDCGSKLKIRSGFDAHMQMICTTEACPNGHSHGASWRKVTRADMKRYGLKRVKQPSAVR